MTTFQFVVSIFARDLLLIPDWTGCRLGFVVDRVEGGSQFSESILERLCSAHASQQNVVTLEFGKSMFTSFSIVCSWLESSWFTTGCTDLSRSVSSPTLNIMLSWQETCLATIWHIFCVCFNNGLPRSIMCQFNVETLTVVRWTCDGFARLHNGPQSIRRNRFFVKRIYIDLLGNGRFSSILHGSRVIFNNGLPRSITTWVWNWLARLETSRWLYNVTANNGFPSSIMICFIFNIEVRAFMRGTCLGGTLRVTCVTANNGYHRSLMFHSFSMKRTCFDLLGTGRFSCSSLRANNGFHRSIMIWVWVWLAWLGTFGVMFQGNLWRVTRWRKNFLVHDFSSVHPNNFRDTISWKCFVKNDSVRSRLIELQSFHQSKIDVDQIHRVLMFLPCFMHVLCKTWCFQFDFLRIFVVFVHGIHKQKEYCLSVTQILTSRYQSLIDDGM